MFMTAQLLTLPEILNLHTVCKLIKEVHDNAYATGRFSSCGFDKYSHHSAAEAAGMIAPCHWHSSPLVSFRCRRLGI